MKEEKKDSGSLLRSFPLLDRFERDGKRIRTHAERRVKLGLVLAKIGEENKIVVNDDEVQKTIEEQISSQPDAKDQILSFYKNNSQALASLKAPIFEEKIIDYILSTIKIDKKEISKKELFKKQI